MQVFLFCCTVACCWCRSTRLMVVMAFSSRARIFGECSTIHSLPALFFKVEISWRTLNPLFRPGSVHSGLASWCDCDRVLPDELRVSSFSNRFPHCTWTEAQTAHSDFVGSRGVCVFRCNHPPALLAEWPESFTCRCGNTGVERTPNKSQHTQLALQKKILPTLLPGFELATFRSRVRRSTYKLSQ